MTGIFKINNNEIIDSSGNLTSYVGFPAGHVIQTVVAKKSDENSASQSAVTMTKVVDGSGNAEWRCQIDNVTSGNDIIVSASFSVRHQHTEDRRGIAYGFMRDTSVSNSGGTAVYEFSNGHAIYLDARSMYGGTSGTIVLYDMLNLMYVDENPGSGTFVYYVGMEVQNGGSSSILRSEVSSGNFPFVMTLQEIKR